MKKIIISIAMFAIAIALLVAVIVPLANHGRENGVKVEGQLDTVDSQINTLSGTIR
ncbi:hypothetical protein Cpap_2187 [Ruminiclostridium papyrosolvens DSM 2782]|uniref:Uncharacterized protein n=1 Tax=Ruminiclostridium papyrosolvens DSM 2782 TaxID=588581 RepID=F1TCR7_9FIRM|nr:hypothetical protein [Ruminiclostridium papyrosolvens]EGD47784.1 hypothetical protein Cpap_2187 [Ruminiclostridium papyrosolvens DSM 2782]WES34501.1 hypothetical protein P0092_00550 [Ruminiclostridium papyrosolvens DSM 2782]